MRNRNLPHFVYELRDSEGRLVYVGCTSSLPRRLAQHERQRWWAEVVEVRSTRYRTKFAAMDVELSLIHEHQPRQNGTGTDVASDARRVARDAGA
jgi:excinuclease UvrABC nuclease subunit